MAFAYWSWLCPRCYRAVFPINYSWDAQIHHGHRKECYTSNFRYQGCHGGRSWREWGWIRCPASWRTQSYMGRFCSSLWQMAKWQSSSRDCVFLVCTRRELMMLVFFLPTNWKIIRLLSMVWDWTLQLSCKPFTLVEYLVKTLEEFTITCTTLALVILSCRSQAWFLAIGRLSFSLIPGDVSPSSLWVSAFSLSFLSLWVRLPWFDWAKNLEFALRSRFRIRQAHCDCACPEGLCIPLLPGQLLPEFRSQFDHVHRPWGDLPYSLSFNRPWYICCIR